jgi:dTDP-4-dehydrorhamnose reductase
MKKKIFIIGHKSRLAQYLIPELSKEFLLNYSFMNISVDYSNYNNLFKNLERFKPDIIINLAALTNVDRCAKNIILAYNSNYLLVKNIVKWINKKKVYLIQISTDHVYDSKNNTEDNINIKNIYGLTKVMADFESLNCKSLILRTNFLCKSYNKKRLTFSDVVINRIKTNSKIILFKNIYFTPLHASTLSKIIKRICLMRRIKLGIYNVGSINKISKYHFIKNLTKFIGLKLNNVVKIDFNKNNMLSGRPKNMQLNCKKFLKDFNISLPTSNKEIKILADEYNCK